MNFDHFKVSTRLLALVGGMAVMLVIGGALGVTLLAQSNAALRTTYEDRMLPAEQLAEIDALNLKSRLAIAGALLYPDEVVQSIAQIEAHQEKIAKEWAAYMATELTSEEAKLAKQLVDDRARFVSQGIQPAVAALRANDIEGAKSIVYDKVRPLYGPVQQGVDALIKLQLNVAREEYAAAMTRYSRMRNVSMGGTALGIVLALAVGLAISRSIIRQLGAEPVDVLTVTTAIAAGDLTTPIAVKSRDTASVIAGMAAMQRSLVTVVSQVHQGAESVQTASAEIAQGNQDLSARTESQASALQETAASMEQLSSAVQQNADNARQANQLSLNASMVAERGGEIVQMVVSTMKDINDSSRKIADIINVIDGIAFQTNILALNAAVEAARAGEQGRGFAVVASEVRSLAGRSAEAAKEIKTLINASVERVEAGSHLVDEAGATMSEVVGAVKRVTDLMGEISAASVEQASGVAQVGEAVTQMDQVTQQNAALVEEMAAAASSLKSQAQDLVQTVAVFQLTDAPVAQRPAPVRTVDAQPLRALEATGSAGINLDNAIKAHAAWRTKLRAAASSGEQLDIDCISRDDCCEMGKWLHGAGSVKFGHRPVFVDLLAQHRAFHQEAGKVARAASHRSPEVESMLASGSRFSAVSNEVTRLIVLLKRELAGGGGALASANVRAAAPRHAYLGTEHRKLGFTPQGAWDAQSEANQVIQSVKQQAKAQPTRPVPAQSPVEVDAWETF